MNRIKRVCVFCGSHSGVRPEYAAGARALASALLRNGLTLVYGGGSIGIMGVLADEMLRNGGSVIGIMPRSLWRREVGHAALTELSVVDSMHERKATMADLADAFVALPGGLGTLEEIFEIWTWAQLGMHEKPCGFLNVAGYFDPLMAFLDRAAEEGFIAPKHRAIVIVTTDPEVLLQRFEAYEAPTLEKWIDRGET